MYHRPFKKSCETFMLLAPNNFTTFQNFKMWTKNFIEKKIPGKYLQKLYHRRPDVSPSSDNKMGPPRWIQLQTWKAVRGVGVYQIPGEGGRAPSPPALSRQLRLTFWLQRSCFLMSICKKMKKKWWKMMHRVTDWVIKFRYSEKATKKWKKISQFHSTLLSL